MKRTVHMHLVAAVTFAFAATSGCAPSLLQEYPFDGEVEGGAKVQNEELSGGVTRTTVDASSKEVWIYLDLDSKSELSADDAIATNAWELQFQRFKIYSNSGPHGTGGVGVAVLPGQSFDALTAAPAENQFQSDVDDAQSENDSPFLAGDGWYLYDLLKHKLAARDTVYVVRTGEGAYLKLQFLEYYDSAGTAGVISFKSAQLAP